jgi:hypothetical protein
MVLAVRVCTEGQQWEHLSPVSRGGLPGLAGVTTRPAGYHQLSRGSSTYLLWRSVGPRWTLM